MLSGPRIQRRPGEFGAVVAGHGLRQRPIQTPADPLTPNGDIDLNHRHLFRGRIGHGHTRDPSAIGQPVMDKIHRRPEPGRTGFGSATRGTAAAFPHPTAQRESFLPISGRPSYDSLASLPVATAQRCGDTHAAACSRPSPGSSSAGRRHPVSDCGSATCSDSGPLTDSLAVDQSNACRQKRGGGPLRLGPYQFFAVMAFSA